MRTVYSVLAVAVLACKIDERGTPPTAPPPLTTSPPPPALATPGSDGASPEVRVYTAPSFLAAWEKTEPAELARTFPPSPPRYRISGDFITVETPVLLDSQGRPDPARKASSDAFVQAGPGKKVALRFEPTSADLPKVKGLKPGTTLTATCAFHGLAEVGVVTFEGCSL